MVSVIPFRALLTALTLVFATRVYLQFMLQYIEVDLMPGFDLWHSNTISYETLLFLQLVLLILMVTGILLTGSQKARPRLGVFLLSVGWLYVATMLVRMIIGAFDLIEHSWFDGAVPTAFHFVLAAYVLVFGSAMRGQWLNGKTPPNSDLIRKLAYPTLIGGGYLLFIWLIKTGSPMLFAAYLSVVVAAIGILLHETFVPNREAWRPNAEDVLYDGIFLSVVQVGLPAVLKGLALLLIVKLAQNGEAPLKEYWPHQAPVLLQVLLMLVIAEFFRYWLHRTFHRNRVLWKLHAVHHAAEKLYTVNVGRFHPFDKALQFLGDTLPFLLLGVSGEVFAAYFVLYAINGFYQHSNSDVRLGLLNWIIAGPELHRWHHSAKLAEANSNYGNNLIVWDAIFGTRFLPINKQVGRVGIGNRNWPNGFLQQIAAPFTTSTEQTPDSTER
ncbi:MAG: hypothetical protein GKR97_19390 [Rhizobiaceae bacterium]|nr:hypothetical protein [Rhizobiaceae bacterium]